MADEPKPVTTPAPAPRQAEPPIQQVPTPDQPSSDESRVSVKPVKSFRWGDAIKQPGGDAFEVSRHEAADLHRNGLVDFGSEDDEKSWHEVLGAAAVESAKARRAVVSGVRDADKSPGPLKPAPLKLNT